MIQRLRFCCGYFAWWMGYFAVIRAVFLVYNHAEAARIGIANLAGTFGHGARMDMSAAAILSLLVFILTAVSVFVPKWAGRVIIWYSLAMIAVISLLAAIDV